MGMYVTGIRKHTDPTKSTYTFLFRFPIFPFFAISIAFDLQSLANMRLNCEFPNEAGKVYLNLASNKWLEKGVCGWQYNFFTTIITRHDTTRRWRRPYCEFFQFDAWFVWQVASWKLLALIYGLAIQMSCKLHNGHNKSKTSLCSVCQVVSSCPLLRGATINWAA